MGSLNSLGIRLEEVQNLLDELRQIPDPDMAIAVRVNTTWPDALVIRLAHTRREMSRDYEGQKRTEIHLLDILWAVDFLDHIDTMGLAVRPKRALSVKRDTKEATKKNARDNELPGSEE